MAKYVLGEEGARKFKQLTKQVTGIRNFDRYPKTHAIDNLYPHPYEVRWSESQISGGGYMIWLPPNCIQVDGQNIDPGNWLPPGGKINNLSDDWWYELEKKIPQGLQPTPINQLSSFDLYLYSTQNSILFTLSASETYQGSTGFVHIAEIENYRSKPNVKSCIILGDSTRRKPFDLIPDGSYSGNPYLHQWIMRDCIWEYNEETIDLKPDFIVPAPPPDPSLSSVYYGLRLVRVEPDDWVIDEVQMANEYDLQTLNQLSTGMVLSRQQQPHEEVQAVYPLYILNSTGGIANDLREAWYIINDGTLSCDDVSITRLSSDNDLSSQWSDKVRIWGFHSHGDSTAFGEGTSFIVRQGGNGVNPPSGNEYLDYLNVSTFRSEILQQVADTFLSGNGDKILSALEFDEQSVSKGGDGWTETGISGNNISSVHMWHFHDSQADVNNPEMCDVVLRYNPNPSSEDKWLRYISYEDFKSKLCADIGGGGGGGAITPDQLSAIPSHGMFAWTESTHTMGPGGVMVGRSWVNATGTGSKSDGTYYVKVTFLANGNATAEVVNSGGTTTDSICYIPIYTISSGRIATDLRGAFVVPAWE